VRITEALLEACALCEVKRFVYLSSIKAVGEGGPTAYDELTPCAPEDAYGTTKRQAELLVAETAARTGMDVVVLRPPLIYGPGVKGNFLQILKLVDHRFPFPISGIHNKRSMLYVGNLTSAIATLLERDRFPEPVFHVADGGEPLSTQDLVRQLGHLMGRRVVLFPAPKLLLRLGGTLLGRRDLVDRLVGSLTVSTDRIESALDWTPPISVAEGLRQTVAWHLSMRETKRGNSNAC
jgi:UDP-glucose 4-epimerase